MDALVGVARGAPKAALARFRFVRTLADGSALYVADRQPGLARTVADLRTTGPGEPRILATACELDLSGGWTEPVDLRPDPAERCLAACGTGLCE